MSMMRFTRRLAVTGLAAFALAACGQAGGEDNGGSAGTGDDSGSIAGAALGEMVKGSADAPIEVIEYASWTCPACLDFDQRVMPTIQSEYIDTGKVRFVFREYPTAPVSISVAGFALARCAGEDKYFDVLDELFDRQPGILAIARDGDQVRVALETIAGNHGIAKGAEFEACLNSQDIRRAIGDRIDLGEQKGVNSTPTIFVNGERLEGFEWRNPEGMAAILDEALGVGPEAADEPLEEPVTESAE
ncbi:MAG: thioredoxin domain-containing protein [Pseudomonadota bacterium]